MTDMRADQIEREIELHLRTLASAASQRDYDFAREALLVLRDARSANRRGPLLMKGTEND
jgi:hypothetical protein